MNKNALYEVNAPIAAASDPASAATPFTRRHAHKADVSHREDAWLERLSDRLEEVAFALRFLIEHLGASMPTSSSSNAGAAQPPLPLTAIETKLDQVLAGLPDLTAASEDPHSSIRALIRETQAAQHADRAKMTRIEEKLDDIKTQLDAANTAREDQSELITECVAVLPDAIVPALQSDIASAQAAAQADHQKALELLENMAARLPDEPASLAGSEALQTLVLMIRSIEEQVGRACDQGAAYQRQSHAAGDAMLQIFRELSGIKKEIAVLGTDAFEAHALGDNPDEATDQIRDLRFAVAEILADTQRQACGG
ncbi:MAG: hypothetical protein AAF626_11380 [Pseudomonadota bacterium]